MGSGVTWTVSKCTLNTLPLRCTGTPAASKETAPACVGPWCAGDYVHYAHYIARVGYKASRVASVVDTQTSTWSTVRRSDGNADGKHEQSHRRPILAVCGIISFILLKSQFIVTATSLVGHLGAEAE